MQEKLEKSCDFLMAEGLEMNQAFIVNCLGNKKRLQNNNNNDHNIVSKQ